MLCPTLGGALGRVWRCQNLPPAGGACRRPRPRWSADTAFPQLATESERLEPPAGVTPVPTGRPERGPGRDRRRLLEGFTLQRTLEPGAMDGVPWVPVLEAGPRVVLWEVGRGLVGRS